MLLSDFDYDLPEDLIAQHPCEPRDHSRLLVLNKVTGMLSHQHFYDLPQYLDAGDTLIFNDTRVIPARLIGTKSGTGGKVEVFLLTRRSADEWEALVKPGKKARPGTIVEFSDDLRCEILSTTDFGGRVVRFIFRGVFEEILDQLGETPLPPYIREQLADKERYQTVYARERGSAAAPTAGLHFTRELMQEIKARGVNLAFVTLHVGLGTFRPVSVLEITEHVMHKEYYAIPAETAAIINQTKKMGKRVIAVGTTAIRTLETAGASGTVGSSSGWTDIFIYP
ncbi:MAG TPA: tRNA preQ1(34) S-adenosylmethionine ribosyltransferase-isomerase QueA, partial [Negativicutes bacterium]